MTQAISPSLFWENYRAIFTLNRGENGPCPPQPS
jgi:hypothetical protein